MGEAVGTAIVLTILLPGLHQRAAFSPTDAMPIAPWAKPAMMVQSVISLAILGLVIARAVNVFA